MKKIILAAVAGIALLGAIPDTASAQLPYYGYGYYAAPYYPPVAYNGFSYYANPWGYRSYNTYSYAATPFGWNAYNYGAVNTRIITNAPYHSIYVDAWGNARMGTGYLNTPSFYQSYRFGY
jgi:hypothetical protein